MRILVVGAGAIGGYFGGRLLAAGRDVVFLVRARRAAQLAQTGLVIRSPLGDASIAAPLVVVADQLREPFDLILLSCKAYDLAAAVDSFAPAVGANTAILPLLNGMAHLDLLAARFGRRAVLGGLCVISATLDAEGRILHLNNAHLLSFGEQDGVVSARGEAIAAALSGAGFDWRFSEAILQEMWEKWTTIAAAAGINCLMRAAVGDIVAAGAAPLALALIDECCALAAAHGFPPRQASKKFTQTMLTAPGSTLMASMLRDIERGAPIEADHVIGDLIRRGEAQLPQMALLRIAYAHMRAYEARRARETAVEPAKG
ncbi:MAG TPA: 2-dehydropantoate 2-reductase [Xanthobacteraceae bacterium]|nr:2-dehydropantoate 2-reductase [Xanthobacteraceae bacterium]